MEDFSQARALAMLHAIKQQRDSALDQVVNLLGIIAEKEEEIVALKKGEPS